MAIFGPKDKKEKKERQNSDEIEDIIKDIDIEADDDEMLAKKIEHRIAEAKHLHDGRVRIAKRNLLIFRGKIDKLLEDYPEKVDYNSKSVLSRVFFIVRNLVGLSTDNPAEVIIAPDNDKPKSIERAKKIEQNIEWGRIRTNFNDMIAMCLFDTWVKGDSFLHWFWNYDINDFDFEPYTLEDVLISPDGKDTQDAEYVILQPYRNRSWFKKNYEDLYDKIEFDHRYDKDKGEFIETTDRQRGTMTRVFSYWEDELLVVKVRKKSTGSEKEWEILEKKQNPYYEFRTPEEQFSEEMGIDMGQMTDGMVGDVGADSFKPVINYFQYPRKPIVQIPSIKLLGEFYSEDIMSHIERVLMSMNMKKRAFNDNLAGCNDKWVMDENAVSEEEAGKITNEPNQTIRADFNENPKPAYLEKGSPVPQSFHQDINHDEQYIDDIFGHHEISRGAGKADTLGQDQMNAESDRTPVRYQIRATERAIVECVQGSIQLMKMFYTEAHTAKKFSQDNSMKSLELINDDVEEGQEPMIKPASSMPVSKEGQKRQALEMFTAGALDPYTLFTRIDMGNPKELADRLNNWLNAGIITDEDPEEVRADMQAGHEGTQGNAVENPIEQANSENLSFQAGKEVPPTKPELLSTEHVKMHIVFAKDDENKMEQDDRDTLLAHAEVDKAGLAELMSSGMIEVGGIMKTQEDAQRQAQTQTKTQ